SNSTGARANIGRPGAALCFVSGITHPGSGPRMISPAAMQALVNQATTPKSKSPPFLPGTPGKTPKGKADHSAEQALERQLRTAEEIGRAQDEELEETYRLSKSIEDRAATEEVLAANAGKRRVKEIQDDAKKEKAKQQYDDAQRATLIAAERDVTAAKINNIRLAADKELKDQQYEIDEQIAGSR